MEVCKRCLLVVALALSASSVFAQAPPVAGPGSHLLFTVPAATLAEANANTYRQHRDGAAPVAFPTSVTCTAITPPTTPLTFNCDVLLPSFTAGSHTIAVSAVNASGQSGGTSAALTFTYSTQPIPGTPTNLRIPGQVP